MADAIKLACGVFGRFGELQQWFPGSDPVFILRDRAWLERNFPLLLGADSHSARWAPGERGCGWIRRLDGRWIACWTCVPPWSRDRSIPAWSLALVDDDTFGSFGMLEGVLASLAQVAERGLDQPHIAARESPWTDAAACWLAEFFEVSARGAVRTESGWYQTDWPADQPAVLLAMQAMLSTMAACGVESPGAVACGEWPLSGRSAAQIPPFVYAMPAMSADTSSHIPVPGIPVVRGVALPRFVRSIRDAIRVARVAAERHDGSAKPMFGELAAAAVPLRLVPPGLLERSEWHEWARVQADAAGPPASLESLTDNLIRSGAGDSIIGPCLGLAMEWAERAQTDPATCERRVRDWIAVLAREPGTR
jgi:hypothetical protein